MTLKPVYYTLARHSAWTVRRDPDFEHAVEFRQVPVARIARILAVGGVFFDGYDKAAAAEVAANYPPEVTGLIPRVAGTFSNKVTAEGVEIYIPQPATVGATNS